MQHIRVSSSNIFSVGFDSDSSTLEINFHGGRIYQYLNVPKEVFDALVSSASKGTFFNQRIKDKYRTVRIV